MLQDAYPVCPHVTYNSVSWVAYLLNGKSQSPFTQMKLALHRKIR